MILLSNQQPISAPEEKGIVGNIFWRGRSLYIDYSLKGDRKRYPVIKRRSDSANEIRRCENFAQKVLHKLDIQVVENKFFDIKKTYDPKFWRIVGLYWKNHLSRKKSAAIERFKVNFVLKRWGRLPVSEIHRDDALRWRDELLKEYTVNAVNNRFAYLGAPFNWAMNYARPENRLTFNPVRKIKALVGGKVRRIAKTRDQFERELEAARLCFRPVYLAAWELGCRPEELFLLDWSDVDMEERLIYFRAECTKTSQHRVVPISDRLYPEMEDLYVIHRMTGLDIVFPNNEGRRYTRQGIRWDMGLIRKKLRIKDIWFRDTRKEFVTRKLRHEKRPLLDVMKTTGHETFSTVKRYCLDDLKALRDVVGSTHTNEIEFNPMDAEKCATNRPSEQREAANF